MNLSSLLFGSIAMLSVHFNYMASHASRNLRFNSQAQQSVMEKLSSGFKINTGKDGPADLIQSEKLRAQIEGLERAIQNSTESDNIMGIMEGALGQIQGVLKNMKSLAIESANTGVISKDMIAANQAQMDSALQAIDRILGSTNYGGRKLLTNMQNQGTIGNNYASLLNAGKLEEKYGSKLSDLINRDEMNSDGTLFFLDPEQEHAAQIDENGNLINGDKTFILNGLGENGDESVTLKFAEGTSLDDIVAKLREHADALPDEIKNNPGLFLANRYGEDINQVGLDANALAAIGKMSDAGASSFLANYMQDFSKGMEIDVDGWEKLSDSDKLLLQTADNLSNLTMNDLGSVQVQTGTDKNGNPIYGNLSLSDLYGGGEASLVNDPIAAMKIIDQADKDIGMQRAQIGAVRAMQVHERGAMESAVENLTRMESYLRDTEYAEAMVEFTRTSVLSQASMSILKAAQQQNEFILDLLA